MNGRYEMKTERKPHEQLEHLKLGASEIYFTEKLGLCRQSLPNPNRA